MDIITKKRIREWTLFGLVGAMAVVANLPRHVLDELHLETPLVMAVLGLVVILAMFLYMRFFFFLLYALLAIGANLPEKWAGGLGITQGPLLTTLVLMVALSLLNYFTKLMPSGLEASKGNANPEATKVLLEAIDRDNLSYIKTVLSVSFDLDAMGEHGMTPLMRAALRGNLKVVVMLLKHGASALIVGPSGLASDIAARQGHTQVAERLKQAEAVEAHLAGSRAKNVVDSDSIA